jgi:hypothetical protein
MRTSLALPLLSGLVGLVLIAMSASAPWFEWRTEESAGVEIGVTGVWGAPFFVPGTPLGTVVLSPSHRRTVDLAATLYAALLASGLALWAATPFPPLSRQIGRRRALLAVGGGAAALFLGAAFAAGLVWYVAGRRIGMHSTWLVEMALVRVRTAGPLLLLLSWILQVIPFLRGLRRQSD